MPRILVLLLWCLKFTSEQKKIHSNNTFIFFHNFKMQLYWSWILKIHNKSSSALCALSETVKVMHCTSTDLQLNYFLSLGKVSNQTALLPWQPLRTTASRCLIATASSRSTTSPTVTLLPIHGETLTLMSHPKCFMTPGISKSYFRRLLLLWTVFLWTNQ